MLFFRLRLQAAPYLTMSWRTSRLTVGNVKRLRIQQLLIPDKQTVQLKCGFITATDPYRNYNHLLTFFINMYKRSKWKREIESFVLKCLVNFILHFKASLIHESVDRWQQTHKTQMWWLPSDLLRQNGHQGGQKNQLLI